MPATPHDSVLYGQLFGDQDIGKLFADSTELRAMLVVEGALAKAQARLGLIPETAADQIHRASLEATLDPAALADATGQNGVPVPALVTAFRAELGDGDAAQYVHWGATSQDIHDTGLALRLRQVVALLEDRLKDVVAHLAGLAEDCRDLPMAGRTWGLPATPTSFGAVVASWGMPLVRHLAALETEKPRLLAVSLSGAAGTLSAMEPEGSEVRAELAKDLNLADPGTSLHSTRDHIAAFAGWCSAVCGSLGKMGEDVIGLVHRGEIALSGSGSSSTMPQKQNPVRPSAIVALAKHSVGLAANLQAALIHRDQRDGTAWMVEWLSLPQLCMATGRSLALSVELADGLVPQRDKMRAAVDRDGGLVFAEALSFHLAKSMPRPEAQAAVKELSLEAQALGSTLQRMARNRWPERNFGPLFEAQAQLGDAPSEADRFVDAARAL
ncbi:MAG: adenylosuccinate lyase family protein [Pseudomonadota bacterium]